MASTTYLQVEYSTGKLYEYSKEAREGFQVHEVDGEVKGFRRYLDYGLTAIYKGVSLRDSKIGEQLTLKFQEGIDWVNISVGAYDQKDCFTSWAESIIRFLPALKVGQAYRVYPYVMENEQGYTNRGFSFRENSKDGDKVAPVLFYQKSGESSSDPNAIPSLVWEEKRGKTRPTAASVEAQTDFFYRHLTEAIALTSEGTSQQSSKPEPQPTFNAAALFGEDAGTTPEGNDDDLPF